MKPSRHLARSGPLLKQLVAATRPRIPESKSQVFQESRPASWHCDIESLQLSILDTWLIMDASLVGLPAARSGHHHVNRRGGTKLPHHRAASGPGGHVGSKLKVQSVRHLGIEIPSQWGEAEAPVDCLLGIKHWSQTLPSLGIHDRGLPCHAMDGVGMLTFLLENMDPIPSSIECTCSFLRPPAKSHDTHTHSGSHHVPPLPKPIRGRNPSPRACQPCRSP